MEEFMIYILQKRKSHPSLNLLSTSSRIPALAGQAIRHLTRPKIDLSLYL